MERGFSLTMKVNKLKIKNYYFSLCLRQYIYLLIISLTLKNYFDLYQIIMSFS